MDAILAAEVVVELGRDEAQEAGDGKDAAEEAPEVHRIGSRRKTAVSRKPLKTMLQETPQSVNGRAQMILPSTTTMTLGVT